MAMNFTNGPLKLLNWQIASNKCCQIRVFGKLFQICKVLGLRARDLSEELKQAITLFVGHFADTLILSHYELDDLDLCQRIDILVFQGFNQFIISCGQFYWLLKQSFGHVVQSANIFVNAKILIVQVEFLREIRIYLLVVSIKC